MEIDYKYRVEYAKSNRASCRACKCTIALGSLRLATLVQSPHFDGKIPYWFHFNCFFKKSKLISTSEIECFDGIKFEDQERIRQEMSAERFDLGLYGLKSAKDAPKKCTHCSKPLEDPYFVDGKKRELGTSLHVKCFMKKNPNVNLAKIAGLSKLNADEKKELLAAANAVKQSRKRATENAASENVPRKKNKNDGANSSGDANIENELRKQSEQLWTLKNKLEVEVTKDALIGMLEYNEQFVPKGLSCLLEVVVDGMMFGALAPCPECKKGKLTYVNGQYKCKGMANEWARCLFTTTTPERRAFRIPKSYHDVELLRNYKYKQRNRLFATEVTTSKFSKKVPLAGKHFLLGKGPFQDDLHVRDLAATIKQLGGSIITSPSQQGIYVTSKLELDSCVEATMKFVQKAQDAQMRSVESKALALFAKANSLEEVEKLIDQNAVAGWPIVMKIPTVAKAEPHSKAPACEMESSMQKLQVKGGVAVDPASGLVDLATIVRDAEGRPMNAVLGMVDLARGTNSYYKLQLLRSDFNPQKHWVFRAWGRTGTNIGGTKIEEFPSSHGAIQNFKDFYLKQTGNDWGVAKEDFKKVPSRFYPLDMDYCEDTSMTMALSHIPSKLDVRLQKLMAFLFDEASMTNALMEFEIDIRKMPLGKLSKTQIQEAYGVLGNISRLLQTSAKSKTALEGSDLSQLIGATTQFYTLIPHNFGMKAPPLLDSLKAIKTKSRMLEDLLEMEVAYSLMKTDDDNQDNVLDSHYAKLHNRIQPLDHSSVEFLRIVEYMTKTHASTHSTYSLEVVDIFNVEREGEAANYDKHWRKTENKMMLWHGSRRTNWAGILAQGLRIAPPEAPSTGYMFGKGIYFADMASKSANYCYSSRAAPLGCMLLCEVALGNMHSSLTANDSKLAAGFHSRKGVGATFPNPDSYYTDADGVIYPIGEPVVGEKSGHLLYNEFIVYTTSQVKQKYLVWVDFKFN